MAGRSLFAHTIDGLSGGRLEHCYRASRLARQIASAATGDAFAHPFLRPHRAFVSRRWPVWHPRSSLHRRIFVLHNHPGPNPRPSSETAAAVVLGVVTLVGGAAGTFGGGWIADRVASKRRNGYFLVCAVSSCFAILPAFIALIMHSPAFFLPAIFFAVVFLFVNNAPFHAILVNSVPPAIRASAVAMNIVVIHVCGDVISRFGVGTLSDAIAAG